MSRCSATSAFDPESPRGSQPSSLGKSGLRILLAFAFALASVSPAIAAPIAASPTESPVEFSIPSGRFYTQTNGQGGGNGSGYSVIDDDKAQFWAAFRGLGGVDAVGYPVSQRFEWKGHTTQAFQKMVLQWRPETRGVVFVNVFDEMTSAGKDSWLRDARSTPERLVLDEDGKSWDQVVKNRLSFLDANQAIKTRYFSSPDYINRYGLPTSHVEDLGSSFVVRLQRAVMQQWKVDVPWAKTGDVTVANGGDIGKEAGLFPAASIQPEPGAVVDVDLGAMPGNPRALTVAIDPGHGGNEPGAVHRFADGSLLYEKDVNLKVATMLGNELHRLGYNVVMTRRTDIRVNGDRDVNGDKRISLSDDLQARVDMANNARADILVSVHHNGSGNKDLRGTEVYYSAARPFANDSRDLAMYVQAGLMNTLRESGYPAVDRGHKDESRALGQGRSFYLLGAKTQYRIRPSAMPAIIGEGLFVSNDQEASLLRKDEFLTALARGYVLGVNRFFISRGK